MLSFVPLARQNGTKKIRRKLNYGGSNPQVTGHRLQVAQFEGTTKNISPIYNLSVVINRY